MTRSAEQVYDELLVLRARDGDEKAFGELVSRWNGRLTGHAFQLTGRADAACSCGAETCARDRAACLGRSTTRALSGVSPIAS